MKRERVRSFPPHALRLAVAAVLSVAVAPARTAVTAPARVGESRAIRVARASAGDAGESAARRHEPGAPGTEAKGGGVAARGAIASLAPRGPADFLPIDGACMQDRSPFTLDCSQDDIHIAITSVTVLDDGCRFPGDTVTFNAQIDALKVVAGDRYDIGIYLASDGGNALTGRCHSEVLPYTPADQDCTSNHHPHPCCAGNEVGTCAYTDLDDCEGYCEFRPSLWCNSPSDCNGRCINGYCTNAVTVRCSPGDDCDFGNCSLRFDPPVEICDYCGDMDDSPNPIHASLTQVTAICADGDDNGFLDIAQCLTWRGTGRGESEVCQSPEDAFPGFPDKCGCTRIEVPIPVPKSIEVVKDLIPSDDPGLFNLVVEQPAGNPIDTEPDAGDGGTTGTVDVSAGHCQVGGLACSSTSLCSGKYCVESNGTYTSQPCTRESDCAPAQSCRFDRCVAGGVVVKETAGTDTNLGGYESGITCVDLLAGTCAPVGTSCFSNADCAGGDVCHPGLHMCVVLCANGDGCAGAGSRSLCQGGVCVDPCWTDADCAMGTCSYPTVAACTGCTQLAVGQPIGATRIRCTITNAGKSLAPVCEAGPEVVADCREAVVYGTISDLNNDPVDYTWSAGGDPNITIDPDHGTIDTGVTHDVPPATVTLSPGISVCAGGYTATLTLDASDGSGYCSDSTMVSFQDDVAPMISGVGPDQTLSCPAAPVFSSPTASDNCDPDPVLSYSDTTTPGDCAGTTTVTRTWTATDACGNTATDSQTIEVVDTTRPVLDGVPDDVTIQCDEPVPPPAEVTATDTCDASPAVTFTEVSTKTSNQSCTDFSYEITRTWTATDACGNVASDGQVITVQDTAAPVLSGVPANATVECDEVPAPANVTATDNCDPNPFVQFTESSTRTNNGSCSDFSYTITRRWRAGDHCNNGSPMATQVITVVDTTAPVVDGGLADETIECPEVPAFDTPTAFDNCDPDPALTHSDTTTPGDCPGTYTVTRTWTATDHCGNSSTASQTIHVVDTMRPAIENVPADATVECDEIPPPLGSGVTASDTCDPDPVLSYSDTTTPGDCAGTYTVTRTWTATDACGNTATDSQTIEVVDTTRPVLDGVPDDVTVQCDEPVPPPAEVSATDTCDASPAVTFTEVSTKTSNQSCTDFSYEITRTWTATDACGNVASDGQVITVQDTAAPVLSGVPANATVECDEVPPPADPTASDNCDPAPAVVFSESSNQTHDGTRGDYNYTITRTWTATDACGNASSQSQVIIVQDTTAPALDPVADVTVECDAVPPPVNPAVTDNCDPAPVIAFTETSSQTHDGSSSDYNYTITRTWTATDASGNASSETQVITVVDTTEPMLAGVPADATVECDAVPPAPTPFPHDNCDLAPIVDFSETSTGTNNGSCTDMSYTITRTWTVTDASGNDRTYVQVITVVDTTPPVIENVPADVTVECDQIPPPLGSGVTASDNCDPDPVLSYSDTTTPGDCAASYTITRTWTATDACGNGVAASQTIHVVDTTRPAITGVGGSLTGECGESMPPFSTPSASDNCDPGPALTFTDVTTPGNCPGNTTVTRTWTATDDCGNSSTASQTLTVTDTTTPVISGVGGSLSGQCGMTPPPFSTPSASDSCDPTPTLTFTDVTTPGNCPGNTTVTRTWTATDDCGNSSTASQTLTVSDTTAPVISGVGPDQDIFCPTFPVFSTPSASDTCDPSPTLTYSDTTTPGNCPGGYSVTRTWTAVDDCGNSSTASQTITVRCMGKIGDFVWLDEDRDGIQDPGEPGMPDVTLKLYTELGAVPIATTQTAADGSYSFDTEICGVYRVEVVPPPDFSLTLPEIGFSRALDSNPNPAFVTLTRAEPNDFTVDFGLVRGIEMCPPAPIEGVDGPVGFLSVIVDVNAGVVRVKYTQSTEINDNSYGTSRVGWSGNHTFNNLVGSDKGQFQFFDASGTKQLDFFLDYISATAVTPATPSGWASLGPDGGEGDWVSGDRSKLLSWDTSFARDLNDLGYCSGGACLVDTMGCAGTVDLEVNSPPTMSTTSYDLKCPAAFASGWDFNNAYEMVVSLSAFPGGFGHVEVNSLHNSPAKHGDNLLEPVPCAPAPCTGAIGDRVWDDLDGDGMQEPGEPGIPGVTVNLRSDSGMPIATATTVADGFYQFVNLCPGTYSVAVDVSTLPPSGYESTTPNPFLNIVIDAAHPTFPDADFGFRRCPGSGVMGDFTFLDANGNGFFDGGDSPLPGITLQLFDANGMLLATRSSDASGRYGFADYCNVGSYTIRALPPAGYSGTTTNPRTEIHPTDLTVDFGFVAGTPLCPPEEIPGLDGPAGYLYRWYDASGNLVIRYEQSRGLNDNSYGENAVDWAGGHSFGNLTGSDKAQFMLFSAGGTLVLDFTLDYLSSVAVSPASPSGWASLGPDGGDGEWVSGNRSHLLDWDTSLDQDLNDRGYCSGGSCVRMTPDGAVNLEVDSPPTVNDMSYDLAYPGSFPAGWEFTNAYQMTISKAAFGGDATTARVEVGEIHNSPAKRGSNAIDPAPCPAPCTGSIGDEVFQDLDNDGQRDPGEPPIAGVTVELFNGSGAQIGQTASDGNGRYTFTALCSGTYRVEATTPAGFTGSTPNPRTVTLLLDSSQRTDVDFGFFDQPCGGATMGNFVWKDLDNDGFQDGGGEVGLDGVTLELYNAAGVLLETTTSAGGGFYGFSRCPGNYVIRAVPPEGQLATTPNPRNVTAPTAGADFGFLPGIEQCPPSSIPGLIGPAGYLYQWLDPSGNLVVRYEQSRGLNDNSYGTGAVGWAGGHKFGDLTGSDGGQFKIFNGSTLVLDFVLDYLSATALAPATPSGWNTLGVSGGDGRCNSPANCATYVLQPITSLASNLNQLGYCTGGTCLVDAGGCSGTVNLEINSPPTTSSSSYDLACPAAFAAGWDFTNAYQFTIAKAAFGGTVPAAARAEVGVVHNSPAKAGSNAIDPQPCAPPPTGSCNVSGGATLTFHNGEVKWNVTNSGSSAVRVTRIRLRFPAANGVLNEVQLAGKSVWKPASCGLPAADPEPGFVTITPCLGNVNDRTLGAGQIKELKFKFSKNANTTPSSYSFEAIFEGASGSCSARFNISSLAAACGPGDERMVLLDAGAADAGPTGERRRPSVPTCPGPAALVAGGSAVVARELIPAS